MPAIQRLSRLLENLANLSIIAVCLALLLIIGSRAVTNRNEPAESSPTSAVLKTGDVFPTRVIDSTYFQTAERHLLMYLKSTCRFCDESKPFYERLASHVRLQQGSPPRLTVLSTDSVQVIGGYVANNTALSGVSIFSLDTTLLTQLRLPGTPSLVLVNSRGIVQRVWLGKLSAQGETDVFSTLFPATLSHSKP